MTSLMQVLKQILGAFLSSASLPANSSAGSRPPKSPTYSSKPTRISEQGLEIIKNHEALRLKAYMPTKYDVPTIGWGHTKGVRMGTTITVSQAEAFLKSDVAWAEAAVVKRVKVPLKQTQFDALVSFVFNLGEVNFSGSTLLRKLNAGDYQGAADQFPVWNKQKQNGKMVVLKGLTRRRAQERSLFLS